MKNADQNEGFNLVGTGEPICVFLTILWVRRDWTVGEWKTVMSTIQEEGF